MPWLLNAPPWNGAAQDPCSTGQSDNRKRHAEQISEAEITLGKLAYATQALIDGQGWRQTIETTRGESHVTASVRSLPHKAARLLAHLLAQEGSRSGDNDPTLET